MSSLAVAESPCKLPVRYRAFEPMLTLYNQSSELRFPEMPRQAVGCVLVGVTAITGWAKVWAADMIETQDHQSWIRIRCEMSAVNSRY